ncbi:Gfo/Idh/MocA family protein [Curtobacterium sp. PhB115]|uniref:Gfo/Idh/MocA family protein n=1 Tax=Curtobacterium sp. PhB115 TaxID=2485173 RepID=UPI000F4D1B75|nr:Gfo/Idh/MocA family oxidoreductase [Curtobacterium sp. PhB115]ROP72613.1 putative dehydrogenase [Curtobacterium sp. PhB115]
MSDFVFPAADGPSLTDTPVLRWGVVGTGQIAGDFVDALHAHTAQRVVAVTSRTTERGDAFAAVHGVERTFTDAHAMAADPGVDVVYVATPHRQHLEGALAAITAGTPVLVEKPLGLSPGEAASVAAASREHGVFAAEGMWTRYHPGFRVLAKLLADGALGDVLLAHADVGWRVPLDVPTRFLDPVEGGALLDMGIYSIWFAQFAIGHATSVAASGRLHDVDGGRVDVASAALFTGATGARATATSTLLGTTDGLASIVGTAGTVRFTDHFVFPGRFAVTIGGESTEWRDPDGLVGRAGLAHEAVGVAALIADGHTSSPLHSLDDSTALATTLAAVRSALDEQDTPR